MPPIASALLVAAGPSLIELGEEAPWWAKLLAGALTLALMAAPYVLPRVTARRAGKTQDSTPTPPPEGTAPVTAQPNTTPATPAQADPEIMVILETLRDYRDELRSVRRDMAAAEERHRQEMAEAERRHREAMAEVTTMLDDRERTITRLEGMIDALTGRRQPPPDAPQPRPGL